MSQATSKTGGVSSPASTGGAGVFFEQHVGAYWLAQLLVRAIPPILHDCAVVEVHFQTEHLGWNTDDFLVVGQNSRGSRRKLIGQVKRTLTVSATDDECKKAVQDSWKDFTNSDQFSPTADRFALIVLRGTNTLLEHFSGLLDCARAARDGAEFESRLATHGFLSAKAVTYFDEIKTIIGEGEARSVCAAEVWSFLRVLHVLSLDLNTSTGQTEATIKSLLAYTTREQDSLGAAEASWNALLREVGEGMPGARSFRRDDLPEALRHRHSPVGGTEQQVLRALSDHSAIILDGIHSTIGKDLHLRRGGLVQKVIEQMGLTQVVLVTGAAGSGKSAIAKDVVGILAEDHFAFSFRAEEFASPHLDEVLQRNQISASAIVLRAILTSQGRKVLLIESVERLLEASTRDAFADLLRLVATDRSWQVVLTCRDYSADLVRACFLESARVVHSVVTVPPLDDAELEEVGAAYSNLARPLANAALRQLLRNPYVLDKALQIPWSDDRPLPHSEREFRACFWREIVRVDGRATAGMPRRRDDVFVQIALRRARALTLYAACGDLDADVVDALRHDSLIVSCHENAKLVAPAHDVLEDWAILQWIDEQWVTHNGSVRDMSAAIDRHPAVRRTYRKWVSELVERDPLRADGLFQSVVDEAGLPAQFRDDSMISLLRSPTSAAFLEKHRAEFLANDKQLLRRVIHLLRVACVTAPAWLNKAAAPGSLFNVPEGLAWACVLRLVQENLGTFAGGDCQLLLGLIEDWARGVSWPCPYPDGADSVAAIAHWLLPYCSGYRSDDQRKRTLQVIAKIPKADRDRFAALLRGGRDDGGRDRTREDFCEIIFEGMEGMPTGRDMPEVLVSAANDYFLCTEAELREEGDFGCDLELETLFGIKRDRRCGYLPASAYRGPFLPLLRHHARQGLAFIIAVFNHSADWYAHPRVRSDYVEPPFEMTLDFLDGTTKKQWCNGRLWNLYRGSSVGPYVLQSLLMALERWLLELGEAQSCRLDAVLRHLLRQSDSAAVTAVVASVATAFPRASGETLLALLSSRECIALDRARLSSESQATSALFGMIPTLNAGNRIYEEERKDADALPHRRHDLEMAVAELQLGPLAPRVHEILDRHRAEMPPVQEQNEEDRVWRLAIHRMDLRQYTVAADAAQTHPVGEGHTTHEDGRRYVPLIMNVPEPDLKAMVDQSTTELQAVHAQSVLLMWGLKVFKGEESATYVPAQWQERLTQARATGKDREEDHEVGRGGPGYVAALCIRDHWEEITDGEREWCLDRACWEVERAANRWDRMARVQRYDASADRPCAWVMSILLGKSLSKAQRKRVRQALVLALTHAIDEVRWYAAWGIGKSLWVIDRDLTLRCVNALAAEATLLQKAMEAERKRPYQKRRQHEEIDAQAAALVRRRFFRARAIADDGYSLLDPTQWFGAEANGRILAILGQAPTEQLAITAFQRLAQTLVTWWDADDDRRRKGHHQRRERNDEAESAQTNLLEDYMLRTPLAAATTILQPILDAVDRHPRKCHWVLQGLISAEDRRPNTQQFWSLWNLFADRIRRAEWLSGIDEEHAEGKEMTSAIFLGTWWKDEARHWRSLEGHAENVDCLFESLPACSAILDDYVRFLYHIGEQSLPGAFIRIAARLKQGTPGRMLRQANTVFMLEVLLQRYVYGRPMELKRQNDLRDATFVLLDLLVEQGSSAAFRMRDDFVTPLPHNVEVR